MIFFVQIITAMQMLYQIDL